MRTTAAAAEAATREQSMNVYLFTAKSIRNAKSFSGESHKADYKSYQFIKCVEYASERERESDCVLMLICG